MRTRLKRPRASEELGEPEILPMMNVLFMLVMVLMGMSAFLPIGVIDIQAPRLGGNAPPASEATQVPEINLTVMLLKSGINLSVAGQIIKLAGYDYPGLQTKLSSIKAQYPYERKILIMADPDVIYDVITHTMDAARVSPSGSLMFDQVAFVPGVIE